MSIESLKKTASVNPWVWLVVAPLLLSVVVSLTLVTASVLYGDDVVSDNYYKEGKLVNNRFAAEHHARQQHIEGDLTLYAGSGRLELQLTQPRDSTEILELKLSHPLVAAKDQTFTLTRYSATGYVANLTQIPSGRWYIRVEGFTPERNPALLWRLGGEVDFSASSSLHLR